MSLITRVKNTVVNLLAGAGVAAVIGLLVLLPVTLFVFCSWIVWEIAGLFGGLGFGWCMLITLLIGPAIGLLESLLGALARPFKRSSQAWVSFLSPADWASADVVCVLPFIRLLLQGVLTGYSRLTYG